MIVELNKTIYHVENYEFVNVPNELYNNLIIKDKLGYFERIVSLIKELSSLIVTDLICYNQTHGGFIPINCSKNFEQIFLLKTANLHQNNIKQNTSERNIENIFTNINKKLNNLIIYSENSFDIDSNLVDEFEPIVLTNYSQSKTLSELKNYKHCYLLSNSDLCLYIPNYLHQHFIKEFYYYIDTQTNKLNYDNLMNLCIMVKNGGELFEKMLETNINIIDRWTILDTGSTDGTIETINRLLVGKKKGQLYEEPFINFRDSRNRCLSLAGTSCKYNIMLDDTYCIEGELRSFLNEIRGDQFGDSYSLTIKSHDVEYIAWKLYPFLNNYQKKCVIIYLTF